MTKKIVILFTLLIFAFGLSVGTVYAQPTPPTKPTASKKVDKTGLGSALNNLDNSTKGSDLPKNLETTLGRVIKAALSLVGTVFLILTVYAGILWMTARGKEEQVEDAVKIIKASIIGLFVVMSAYAITYFITSKLAG